MNMHDARRSAGGLTFIELLIVLFIVGMGWFTLVPNLDLAGNRGEDTLSKVNAFLYEARVEAVEKDLRQDIVVDFAKGKIFWNEEEISLPSRIVNGHFNESPVDEGTATFYIYPEGFSDEVRLVFGDGLTIVLDPLDVRFKEL
ncbi:Tfp pilus assembly protein FimT/FimU [Maridesulfovibrio sp.]|uniref:pilus assembly FimT family protein n=1 Tax=Maridesulfovibrio sp. TaxID=2795000 RepID=UPI0029F4E059|nr:prepilin-type cleavage/methylation domain-containing protein [Maridesulfovibrio sp.]